MSARDEQQDGKITALGASFTSPFGPVSASGPLARSAIDRDLENAGFAPEDPSDEDGEEGVPIGHSEFLMKESYNRTNFVANGPRSTVLASMSLPDHGYLSRREREALHAEERSLLRDNHLIPQKHPRRISESQYTARQGGRSIIAALRRVKSQPGDEEASLATKAKNRAPLEYTALLQDPLKPYGGQDTPANISQKWGEAVANGQIHTTWQREAKVLAKYSRSLILTFFLQYSLTVASVLTVGRIGKIELGAISLASMTANITGYAIYQGLATSLDTLCSQAYGSGRKTLVGLQLQRMVYFLWSISIPIAIIWFNGTAILERIVPEKETARLAGLYLRVLILGLPGYAAFESGKRFVQAQGLFSATLYVLLICAPLNALLNWLFVWRFGWGFIGAPIAVVVTENLLPLCLFLYVRFINGIECWGGFEIRSLSNWGPMIQLALPGLVMLLAEFFAFEILTLSASWFSTTHLAAQSILSTVAAITYQVPFPISIAASTRIANFIGATLASPAKTAAKVALVAACIVGSFNAIVLGGLREYIPQLFTDDPDVIELVANVLPICVAFQLFDALATNCSGILRGIGKQSIGGYVNLFAYYAIAMPVSFGTGFGLNWALYGLWTGPAIALAVVSVIEGWYIYRTSWEKAVEEANMRNSLG